MDTERNCYFCEHYKDGYCKNLELKPCYPQKGCDDFSKQEPPKTGHWVYKIYGGFHEQGNWYCSHCDYRYNYGNGHAKFCPECGYEMSEPPIEEVIGDKDYDWIIKRT